MFMAHQQSTTPDRLRCRTTLKRRPAPFKDGLGLGLQGLWMVLIPTKSRRNKWYQWYVHDCIKQYTYHNLSIHIWDIWRIYHIYKYIYIYTHVCLILQIVWCNVSILNDAPPPMNCHYAGYCIFGAGSLLTFTFHSYWYISYPNLVLKQLELLHLNTQKPLWSVYQISTMNTTWFHHQLIPFCRTKQAFFQGLKYV